MLITVCRNCNFASQLLYATSRMQRCCVSIVRSKKREKNRRTILAQQVLIIVIGLIGEEVAQKRFSIEQ